MTGLPIKSLTGALLLTATLATAQAQNTVEDGIGTQYETVKLVEMTDGLTHPWSLGFLPGNRYLITERNDGLYLLEDGEKHRVSGVPEFHATNQGGLLDVVVHPDYDDNGWIYLTYSKGDSDSSVPALIRARLDGHTLVDTEQLFESNTPTEPGRHYGGKLVFLDDGSLLMTVGDRGGQPPRAQDNMDHSGTIVRLYADGSIPDDNPFVGQEGYLPQIYSYGHRNIQGIIQDPETGKIWVSEHGPRGGDELNLIEPGKNYGWPVATLGLDYGSEGTFPDAETRHKEGMEDPVYEFLPTLAPSGLAIIHGERFENWQGNLLAGGLGAQRILRVVLEDSTVIHLEELLLHEIGRIRDVRQGPNGYIYILNDESDASLYRLEPAS